MLILSFTCYSIFATFTIAFGLIYFFRPEFMPYYQVALNQSWQELKPEIQTLILPLMRAVGGGLLATGIDELFLLITYQQTQEYLILCIIPIIGLISSLGALYATILVKTKTTTLSLCLVQENRTRFLTF